jgi:SAM-dependent methyltransferase
MPDPEAARFIAALLDRYAAPLRRSEFLKAIRALSARYVERRAALTDRSPLDSAGKRAAFAAYYGALHYLTVWKVLDALDPAPPRSSRPPLTRIVDLGCGTGVAGAAWAKRLNAGAAIRGVDRSGWAVTEAAWAYRTLGLAGRVTRGDLVRAASSLLSRADRQLDRTGIVLAWSSNELDDDARTILLTTLVELGQAGASILVVEPVSRRAAPWFDDWADVITKAGGRHDDWSFDAPRPAALAEIDAEAGFDRDALTARTLAINPP